MMETFTCPRHPGDLTLTTIGCASMWKRARAGKYESGESIQSCRGCLIGAQHAGMPAGADRHYGHVDMICLRCHREAQRRVRGVICVSCYNRELEFLKGRNAKGRKPVRVPAVHQESVTVIQHGVPRTVSVERVADPLEALLVVVRRTDEQVAFGWSGGWGSRAVTGQLSLW